MVLETVPHARGFLTQTLQLFFSAICHVPASDFLTLASRCRLLTPSKQ